MNDNLESVLNEVKKYVRPAKETTLFAVGGRGYYENPASDLLAFFLKPDAEHGLGNLFLSTYFECMEVDHSQLNMSHVRIDREVPTANQNFIDLQILGRDWCLIIENKIRHWEANPFEDYEKHAKALLHEKKFFSVLSPSGSIRKDGKKEDWKGVSYPNYCETLRQKMPEIDSYNPRSKWQLFAREFILHLKNELDSTPMTPKQARFVEEHAAELFQARELFQEYPNHLCSILKEKIEKELCYKAEFKISNWGILIKSPERWGKAYLAFRTPTDRITDHGDRTANFDLCIFPDEGKLKPDQSDANQSDLLKGMRYNPKGVWVTEKGFGFQDCDEAIKDLLSRIKLIERPTLC